MYTVHDRWEEAKSSSHSASRVNIDRETSEWGTIINDLESSYVTKQENFVYYLVASPVKDPRGIGIQQVVSGVVGSFPGFDAMKRLVGFYRETQDKYNTTVITFLPLQEYHNEVFASSTVKRSAVSLDKRFIDYLESEFKQKLDRGEVMDLFSLPQVRNPLLHVT